VATYAAAVVSVTVYLLAGFLLKICVIRLRKAYGATGPV
jgi:hypothetical protein